MDTIHEDKYHFEQRKDRLTSVFSLSFIFLRLAPFFQVEFAPLARPIRLLREEERECVEWNIEGGECKEDVDCSIEDVAKYV